MAPPTRGSSVHPRIAKGITMTTETTRTVVGRHMAALQGGDIDNVMRDYTDESV